jgi:predicted nucleic acid-binding protein
MHFRESPTKTAALIMLGIVYSYGYTINEGIEFRDRPERLQYLFRETAAYRQALQAALLDEIARDPYQLEPFDPADIARAKEVVDRFADLAIGLADASIVVLAERHNVNAVLSLDERHFRAMRIDRRKRFKVLPFDH